MHSFRRHSLQCSWTSCLELSADGPQIDGLVIEPFQTVAEDIFWLTEPSCSVNPLLELHFRNPQSLTSTQPSIRREMGNVVAS